MEAIVTCRLSVAECFHINNGIYKIICDSKRIKEVRFKVIKIKSNTKKNVLKLSKKVNIRKMAKIAEVIRKMAKIAEVIRKMAMITEVAQ